ncbi:hypothetical protein HIM_02688 [Hirsutella minnesotensis 3608]|nr:hypothetical protein HIM_02688 [Hirsutella minnesotensis 3608]
MRRGQIIYDGLWRCLCPAFDRGALVQAVDASQSRLSSPARRPACLETREPRLSRPISRRHVATATAAAEVPRAQPLATDWKHLLLGPNSPREKTLRRAPLDEIARALMAMRDAEQWARHDRGIDRHERIIKFIRHLISYREQPLSEYPYESILDALADPQGTADGVRKLLEEMESRGMALSEPICKKALAALVNHPDYVLRQEILDIMKSSWHAIDTDAQHYIVIGMLRDEQYELAYARFTDMIEKRQATLPWVYDIFILVFGKLGFLDELLFLLQRRSSLVASDPVVPSLLYYALDVCSQAFHRQGTTYAWNAMATKSLIQPADGIVENVLTTAARHGDASLATEALDMLSRRARVLPYHYEAVMEAFAIGGNVAGALRILCIMKKNGTSIARDHTVMIRDALRRKPALIDSTETAIRKLVADGEALPLAAAAVVLEAKAEAHGTEDAMELYHDVKSLCGDVTDAITLQTLLINSQTNAVRRALVQHYMSRVPQQADPQRRTSVYGALTTACAQAGEVDAAFRFAARVMAMPDALQDLGWIESLVQCAASQEDGRIWTVVDQVEAKGDEDTKTRMRELLQQQQQLAKRLAERQATFGF